MRALKGLEEMIPLSVTHWLMAQDGWTFADGPGVVPDPIHGARYLHQLYTAAQADYSGRATIPLLWDRRRGTIVNNESADLLRMLNRAFDPLGARAGDYCPDALRAEIDEVNARVYDGLNNGVYKAGFATAQAAYEEAAAAVFETMDWLERRLSDRRWLVGNRFTEADIRLFTTLYRFDEVYHGHFKCNRRRLVDYPALWAFARDVFQIPGVAGTVNMTHVKRHYYESHRTINPTAIVPLGPAPDFAAPHGREALGPAALPA
jgi:putative glutathione S-transferase